MEYSNLFVCLMGMGTVFFGLICIIILVSIMSAIVRKTDKVMKVGEKAAPAPAAPIAASSAAAQVTPEMVAAISAVIAEDMGTDVSAIKIRSIKRV